MTGKRSPLLKTGKMAVVVCALIALSATVVKAESPDADGFEQRLQERSEAYLDSLQNRTCGLPAELRGRIAENARDTVKKGFARLNRPSVLIRKHALAPINSAMLAEAFRNNHEGIRHAAVFLSRNFHRPTELDVAVRVALPSRFHWERRFGILATHRPFTGAASGGSGYFASAGDMIIVSTLRRDTRTWAFVLGQFAFMTLPGRNDGSEGRFFENADLLTGYSQIARTIVLRI